MTRKEENLGLFIGACILLSCMVFIRGSNVPGATTMSVGFDIVKMKYLAKPIFTFTFNNNATWSNPQEQNLIYQVPDQISIINVPHMDEQCLTSTFSSTIEVQQMKCEQFGIGVNFFRVGMGAKSSNIIISFEITALITLIL
jgi:hypothetical protein